MGIKIDILEIAAVLLIAVGILFLVSRLTTAVVITDQFPWFAEGFSLRRKEHLHACKKMDISGNCVEYK